MNRRNTGRPRPMGPLLGGLLATLLWILLLLPFAASLGWFR